MCSKRGSVRSMSVNGRFAVLAALAGTIAGAASTALGHEGDVGLKVESGRLATVLVEGEPPVQVFGDAERVFGVELEFDPVEMIVGAEEPGFATEDAGVLGRTIGFSFTKSLRIWNDGLGAFEATAMRMSAGRVDLGLAAVLTPMVDERAALNPIGSMPIDFHYLWTLEGADTMSGQGVYLVEGVFTNPGGVLGESESVFFVFNYGMDEEVHDAAIAYAARVLVPTPGVGVAAAMMGLTLRRRRR